LYLLGAPFIEVDGAAVSLPRRKALAIAAFLALSDRVQSRATLATLLWPDLDETGARNALRATLPLLTKITAVPWLETDRNTFALNSQWVWSDVQEFTACLVQIRRHVHYNEAPCTKCIAAMESAIKLYRGDFLTGFSLSDSLEFDNWQSTKREWLHQEYIQMLRRLAEYYSVPHIESALVYARRWLEVDPINEVAHRLLIRLYVLNGQRADALRQYQECVHLLDAELATRPEDETVALGNLIRDGGTPPPPALRSRREEKSVNVLPPLPALIIGREAVLSELKYKLGIPDGISRRPTTAIEGWPGVGKSTIIAALAHDPDVAAAFPNGILWASLGEQPNILSELTRWGTALRLIPPNKMPNLDELTGQLTATLRERRVLLIVDDVWQVEHLNPFRVGGQQCSLVVTSRLREAAHALAPTAGDVFRLPQLAQNDALLLLSQLAPDAVRLHPDAALELVNNLEGLPLAIQVAGRLLHEEAQMGWGIEQLLAELQVGSRLLEEQAPSDLRSVSHESTPTVAALLRRSTNSLDPASLTRFAMLGYFAPKPATFDLGAMAALWDVQDARPTVRLLVNRGLLEPLPGGRFQMHAILVLHAKSLTPN
jgi:DNA-binding SARP family transcriptional activator